MHVPVSRQAEGRSPLQGTFLFPYTVKAENGQRKLRRTWAQAGRGSFLPRTPQAEPVAKRKGAGQKLGAAVRTVFHGWYPPLGRGPKFSHYQDTMFSFPCHRRDVGGLLPFCGHLDCRSPAFLYFPCLEKENYFHSRVTYVVDWSVILYKTQGLSQRVKVFSCFCYRAVQKATSRLWQADMPGLCQKADGRLLGELPQHLAHASVHGVQRLGLGCQAQGVLSVIFPKAELSCIHGFFNCVNGESFTYGQ